MLDLGYSTVTTQTNIKQGEALPDLVKKDELRAIFQDEISALAEERITAIEKCLRDDSQKKFDDHKKALDDSFAEKFSALEEVRSKFDVLVSSLKKSYQNKVSEDVVALDEIVIDVAMQCLYKIFSNKDIYNDLVRTNVGQVLEKRSLDSQVSIKVSENEIKYLKKNFADSEWVGSLRVDDRLTDGEMILDDGLSSIYEIGFVNQLDILRTSFIKLLREHHARG